MVQDSEIDVYGRPILAAIVFEQRTKTENAPIGMKKTKRRPSETTSVIKEQLKSLLNEAALCKAAASEKKEEVTAWVS